MNCRIVLVLYPSMVEDVLVVVGNKVTGSHMQLCLLYGTNKSSGGLAPSRFSIQSFFKSNAGLAFEAASAFRHTDVCVCA